MCTEITVGFRVEDDDGIEESILVLPYVFQDAILSAVFFDSEADRDLGAHRPSLLLGRQRGGADPTLSHRLCGFTGTPLNKGTVSPGLSHWLRPRYHGRQQR